MSSGKRLRNVLTLLLLLVCGAQCSERPVIGILAQGTYGHFAQYGNMYIAASYVKFIEAAGGQAVPIFNNLTSSQTMHLFKQLNGVLLPGGGANLTDSGYARNSRIFVDLTMQASKSGEYFPIWATCRGLEELVAMFASPDVMSFFNSTNDSLPLEFTKLAASSRLLGSCPSDVSSWLQSEPLTMNYHRLGITPDVVSATSSLTDVFDVLATSRDRQGLEFVSLMEARSFPIYASIFHPEKSMFEWDPKLAINHSKHAVRAAQYFADFFLTEARKSTHVFPTDENGVSNLFFYNFAPVYTGSFGSMFEQCYFF